MRCRRPAPFAGCGSPATPLTTCGTTRAGTCCPPGTSCWHVKRERSPYCRSRSAPASACISSQASSAQAAALVDEFATVNEVMDNHLPPYGALALAAWRGRQDTVSELVRTYVPVATARGEGMGLSIIYYSSAVLHNSLGQYQEAMAAAERGAGYPQELGFATWSLVELVEAAARSGHPDRAAEAHELLTRRTSASGTDWALGVEARSRALLSQGDAAESSYTEAVERLGRTRIRVELARAHLFYGEWLRREGRRLDARQPRPVGPRHVRRHGRRGVRRTSSS